MTLAGKLSWIRSADPKAAGRPVLVALPGGPGLSSSTLIGVEALAETHDLILIDPPGTGGSEDLEDPSVVSIVHSIESLLLPVKRSVVLLGHSFGAVYAAHLAIRAQLDVKAVVFVGCFLTRASLVLAEETFFKSRTDEVTRLGKEFYDSPTRFRMNEWFASYGSLFFLPNSSELIVSNVRRDLSSPRTFLKLRPGWSATEQFEQQISSLVCPKLIIVGEADMLFAGGAYGQAKALGAQLRVQPSAAHFAFFDQPAAIAASIVSFLRKGVVYEGSP